MLWGELGGFGGGDGDLLVFEEFVPCGVDFGGCFADVDGGGGVEGLDVEVFRGFVVVEGVGELLLDEGEGDGVGVGSWRREEVSKLPSLRREVEGLNLRNSVLKDDS